MAIFRPHLLLPVLLMNLAGQVACFQTMDVEPYLQNASPTSVWVGWETTGAINPMVDFGTTPAFGQTANGSSVSGQGASFIHHVQLTGLTPGTRYYYEARTGTLVSATSTFRTPPALTAETPFTFAAYSDTQAGNVANKHQEVIDQGVLAFFAAEAPGPIEDALSFMLCSGDLVSTGTNHSHWTNHFFGQADDLYRHVPLYPALGNHEANADFYYKYFTLPDNGSTVYAEHWYAYDHQNVRLVTLDTNTGFTNQTQLNWLDATLADAAADDGIDFVFAQMHHPHLSELWTPGNLSYATEIVERLENFTTATGKPTIHFFGHTHGYSRGQSRDHNHLMVNVASGMGSVDYWYEYPQEDYPEFQYSVPEWGFVVMDVEAGLDPKFRLRRVSRGNDFIFRDNEIVDEISVRRFNNGPAKPMALLPGMSSGQVPGIDVALEGSPFSDFDGDPALESHWQVTSVPGDYSAPVAEDWKRRENWYRPPNGDSWYSVNTVTDPNITRTVLSESLPGCSQAWWRVRYRDEALAWSDWSEEQTFMVGESDTGPFAPTPGNGSEGVSLTPILTWTPCTPGEAYDVYFGTTASLGASDYLGTVSATLFGPGLLQPDTEYFWRVDKHLAGQVIAGPVWSFSTSPSYPTVGTAEWRFNDIAPADSFPLDADHGASVMFPWGMSKGVNWDISTTGDGVMPHLDGQPTGYIWLDNVYGASQGLRTFYLAPGNGGGGASDVFEFTMVWDVYLEGHQSELQALWQGNASNSNEAELFMDQSTNGFWVGGGTGYIGNNLWSGGEWVRVVHRVDYSESSALFVNGTKVLSDEELTAPDWLYGAGSGQPVWMLSDDGPVTDVTLVRCANIAIVDALMSDADIAVLGSPNSDGVFVDSPWTNLGNGLAGSLGIPVFLGVGSLKAGQSLSLNLQGALPGSFTYLVGGLSTIHAPFKGGVLVPSPDIILPALPVDPSGDLSLGGIWPAGIPSGFTITFQHWLPDPAALKGFAASNALSGTVP